MLTRGWTENELAEFIENIPEENLCYTEARRAYGDKFVMACHRRFGSYRRAVLLIRGFYPSRGHYKWRIAVYKKNPSLAEAEIAEGLIPQEKLKSIWPFFKDKKKELPKPKISKRLCRRCKRKFAPYRRYYCEECRKEAFKESAKTRQKRWRAKLPEGHKLRISE